MKKTLAIAVLLTLIGAVSAGVAYQSGHDLFQQALSKERSEGDLGGAIELYQEILEKFSNDNGLASKAQLRVGMCYEKLGAQNTELARKAFEAVVRMYPDQVQEVEMARSRLSGLAGAKPTGTQAVSGPSMRQMATMDELPGFYGAASPNGKYLSYIDWTDGNLALFDIETHSKRALTAEGSWETQPNQFGDYSLWSPDGNRIAYVWYQGNESEVRVISFDGSGSRRLHKADDREFVPRTWSKDSKEILGLVAVDEKHAVKGHEDHLSFLRLEDSSIRAVKSLGDLHTMYMDLSPDGGFIVYELEQEKESGVFDIHLISSDGTFENPLIEHRANDRAPFWTSDGRRILFLSDRSGTNGIWSLEVVNGKPAGTPELILTLGDVQPLTLIDDDSLVSLVGKPMRDVFTARLDPDSGQLKPQVSMAKQGVEGVNTHPVWSPDGRYLAYFSLRRNENSTLFIRDMEEGTEKEVTIESKEIVQEGLHGKFRSAWTPDGSGITTVEGVGGQNRQQSLYRIDTQNGEVSKVFSTDSEHSILDYSWSRDGKTLFYLKHNISSFKVTLMRVDLSTLVETELYRPEEPLSISHIALSPDNKTLVMRSADPATHARHDLLHLISTDGGEPQVLLDEEVQENYNISSVGGMEWTSDGKWVLFGRWDGYPTDSLQLCRISVTGGKSERLGKPFPFASLSLSPKDDTLAYSTTYMGSKSGIWIFTDLIPD